MTTGFPDFGRYTPVSGNTLISESVSNGGYTSSVFSSAFYNTLVVSTATSSAANFYELNFLWYADSLGVTQIASSKYVLSPLNDNTWVVPVRSGWCQVTMTLLSGTTTESFWLSVFGSQNGFQNIGSEQAGKSLLQWNRNVGASGNSTVGPGPLAIGPATLSIWHAANNSWLASLYYFDPGTAAYVQFIAITGSTYGQGLITRISLPPSPVYVSITNQDTSTRAFTGSITLG